MKKLIFSIAILNLIYFLSCTAPLMEQPGGKPGWVDNPTKGSMDEGVIYGIGIAEGYSESDLRRVAAANARQEIADTLLTNIKGTISTSANELMNFKNLSESESQSIIKTTSEQSNTMSLPLVAIENYYTDKRAENRLAVYARAKLDLRKVKLNEIIKLNFKNSLNSFVNEGKLIYSEEELANIYKTIDETFAVK